VNQIDFQQVCLLFLINTGIDDYKCFSVYSLHRTTVLAASAFLDAFQKVADMGTNTRGTFFS